MPEGDGGRGRDRQGASAGAGERGYGTPLKLEEFLPYRLNVLASLVSQALSRIYVERYGLGVPEWRVLVTLGQFGVMTGKAIGAHSHMHKTKVSRAVAELEKRKLIGAARQPRRPARVVPLAHRRRPRDLRGARAGRARVRAPARPRWSIPPTAPAFERAMQRLTERSRALAAEVAAREANGE